MDSEERDDVSQDQTQDQGQDQTPSMPTFDPSQYPFLNDLAQGSSFDDMLASLDQADDGDDSSRSEFA